MILAAEKDVDDRLREEDLGVHVTSLEPGNHCNVRASSLAACSSDVGRTPRGSCNHTLLRRVFRRCTLYGVQ